MAENYKHLYEQTKKMLAMYQDELIPGFRKKIEELEGTVCDLRSKWQMAETHICTMCEHFDHKVDGNIVYGNMTCGELVGYPCCGKFKLRATDNNVGSKWISVKERLPEEEGWYQVYTAPDKGYKSINKAMFRKGFEWNNFTPRWHGAGGTWGNVTHWMPLPEPPKEVE